MQQMVQKSVDHAIKGISLCAVVMIVETWSRRKLGARCEWVVNTTPWLLYPQEIEPVPTVQELGVPQGTKFRPPLELHM